MPNWSEVLKEIQAEIQSHELAKRSAVDSVRKKYLDQLHTHTGRNVIAYYSGWLSKPGVAQAEINDEDRNGFMMAVHKLDRTKGLDLVLHTPGGSIAATQSLVLYLHQMFNDDVRAIVPELAMSAGTMVACSCKKILLAKHSNLGPTDPHVRGLPAHGVIAEFEKACREVKADPTRAAMWQLIIGQYRPTFLSQCRNAIDWSNQFVREQLERVMLAGQKDAKRRAKAIAERLSNWKKNKTHERHISADECIALGLMHTLMNTTAFKIIENHLGTAFIKRQELVALPQQVIQGALTRFTAP